MNPPNIPDTANPARRGPDVVGAAVRTAIILPWRRVPYAECLQAMREFTATRGPDTPDQIWLVEHPPVFTLGLAADPRHLLACGEIPVERTERGGEVTYHGPGQVVAYLLYDLRRMRVLIKDFVLRMEAATIGLLAGHQVLAVRRPGAPGVYVDDGDGGAGAKIAALGIKVSRGCTYHGIALNVAMDLEPFRRIDPCGYPGQPVTDLRTLVGGVDPARIADEFARLLARHIESPR